MWDRYENDENDDEDYKNPNIGGGVLGVGCFLLFLGLLSLSNPMSGGGALIGLGLLLIIWGGLMKATGW